MCSADFAHGTWKFVAPHKQDALWYNCRIQRIREIVCTASMRRVAQPVYINTCEIEIIFDWLV